MEHKCTECDSQGSTVKKRKAMMTVDNLPRDNRFPKDRLSIYINRDMCDECWWKLKQHNQSIVEL